MVRPQKCRTVSALPGVTYFKPAGIPLRFLKEVHLSVEQAEALRLKDIEGLEQIQAAVRMGVSRPTFQRVLTSARKRVADALLNGKAIRIEGGNFQVVPVALCCHDDQNVTCKNKGGRFMKYAMPVSGSRLMSHFGQANEFMLMDVDQDGRVVRKETIAVTPHSCGTLPGELAKRGVSVVLAGGMGMGPRMAFQQSNIEVVLGVTEPDPEKAAVAYANHTLENGVNVCEHGDTICDNTKTHA
jgi:predicted DNA-binding protein (UPF0251 family)/predicted Fe-Mo cluster-binding NifX family protein